MKRPLTEWEKIFTNDMSDKKLIFKIYKKLIQTTSNNQNPIVKCAYDLSRYFSKEDTQTTNRHMKRCSASLINRERQVKTVVSYHLTPVRMSITQETTTRWCWRGRGQEGTPCTGSGNGPSRSTRENSTEAPQKTRIQRDSISAYLHEENENTNSKRYMCPSVYFIIPYNTQDKEITSVFVQRQMNW